MLAGLLTTTVVLAQAEVVDHSAHWSGGGFLVWRLGMLLFWIIIVGLVLTWFRRNGRHREPTGIERAKDILAERMARGEISPEEYQERMIHLS